MVIYRFCSCGLYAVDPDHDCTFLIRDIIAFWNFCPGYMYHWVVKQGTVQVLSLGEYILNFKVVVSQAFSLYNLSVPVQVVYIFLEMHFEWSRTMSFIDSSNNSSGCSRKLYNDCKFVLTAKVNLERENSQTPSSYPWYHFTSVPLKDQAASTFYWR